MSITHVLNNNLLVSVIIPLYNYEKYVCKCIESIVSQSYKNIEIVLIDNASTDNGLKVAKEKLKSSGVKHKIIENSTNLGICASLNLAIKAVRGAYTCIISSDDLLASGRIKRHIQILEKTNNSKFSVCNGPIRIMNEDSSLTTELRLVGNLKFNKRFNLSSIATKKDCPTLQGCTFKTNILRDLPFDEELFYDDWDFFIRMAINNYNIIHDKSIAAYYRSHDLGLNRKTAKMIESRNKIRLKYYDKIFKIDNKLALEFDFTIDFWNLMGLSYQGKIFTWYYALMRLIIKNPKFSLLKIRDIAWSLKNLIFYKFTKKRKN